MADLTLADLERLETLARKYLQPEYITSDNLYTEPEPIYEIKSKEPAPNYSGQQWLFTAYQNETAELLVHLLNLTPQLIAAARECDALKAELETVNKRLRRYEDVEPSYLLQRSVDRISDDEPNALKRLRLKAKQYMRWNVRYRRAYEQQEAEVEAVKLERDAFIKALFWADMCLGLGTTPQQYLDSDAKIHFGRLLAHKDALFSEFLIEDTAQQPAPEGEHDAS